MSARVAIVTDTTHYLPRDVVQREGVSLVSLYVNWGDRQERESGMADFDGFYEELRSARQLPTTSQPSVGDFLAVYEPLLAEGLDVVSLHISGELSGTAASAAQARDELARTGPGGGAPRVHVVDSRTTCGGFGLVVLAATRAAAAGASAEEVVARAHAAREGMRMWFLVDTLEFLRRGGRVGAASAWVGSALRIKPILTIEASVLPVERVRTARRGFERMVEYMRTLRDDGATGWCVQHIQAADEAQRLAERGREIFGVPPLFVSEVGPVIGVHAGPGMIGVGGAPPP